MNIFGVKKEKKEEYESSEKDKKKEEIIYFENFAFISCEKIRENTRDSTLEQELFELIKNVKELISKNYEHILSVPYTDDICTLDGHLFIKKNKTEESK